MKAQLLLCGRDGATASFAVEERGLVIGRDPDAGVPLPREGVSRRHARVTPDGDGYWLEDLGSTNGTFLNGQPVERARLRHLDVVTLGRKVDLLFVLRGEEPRREPLRAGISRAALVPSDPAAVSVEIPRGEISLGRSTACSVVVEEASVAKVHARIARGVERLVLDDLGSALGTRVNGARVESVELKNGDLIALGDGSPFRVVIERGEPAPPPRAPEAGRRERPSFSAEWKAHFEWSERPAAAPERPTATLPGRPKTGDR